jgi:LysM repeat protein
MIMPKNFVMNLVKTFLLLLAVFVTLPLASANLYIQYDPQCMDRLEYTNTESGQDASYVVYQIKINEQEKLILEVGLEAQRYQTYLPSQSINCSNALFSREMANNINQQIDKAYIVYQKGRKQYYVSPVSFAAYFVHNDEKISYTSPQYQFELNLNRGIIGENIAQNRQRAEVYFDGRLENQCSGAYVFRQFSLYTSSPHMDIIIVPEVGVVEARSGRNAEDALKNIRRLEKVNDQFLSDYMDRVCLGIEPETSTAGGMSTVYQPDTDIQGPAQPSGMQVKGSTTIPKKHTVKQKETLFSIAKSNNVALADLRKWNDLENSNLIRPGDVLWLGPPVDESQIQTKSGAGPDGLPAPYDQVPGVEKFAWGTQQENLNTQDGTAYWEAYPTEYLVQPGETIAGIARKFGFTESRFRKMNNLLPEEEVKIGQRLITSDCKTGAPQPGYDQNYTGTAEDSDLPPYESKIISTTDYYYSQRTQQMKNAGNPQTATASRSGAPAFEPYGSNTPKFYESPEATRVRTTAGASYQPASYNQNEVTPYNLPGRTTTTPAEYDMSTLPQSYDSMGQRSGEQSGARANRTLHFVKQGETLYDISRMYGVSVERLRELNQISPGETIMPYQQIYVN